MATTTLTDSQRVPVLSEQKKQTEYMQSMAESLGKIAKSTWKDNGSLDNYIVTMLDGTKEKYEAVQRAWLLANGADAADAATLTTLLDKWYTITRKPWNGWVRFYHPDVSSQTTGEKMGDLKDMKCVPSTDTVAGQDDFAGNPLFAITYVNWTLDTNGLPQITAIKGVNAGYEQSNPDKLVGVVQMTGYHWWTTIDESSQYYYEGYSSTYLTDKTHIEPLPEAVKPDKTVRPWVIHAPYIAGKSSSGKMTCCSGQIPMGNVSHNNVHDSARVNGANYSGGCSCDRSFLILMARLLFGSLTIDGILNGCYSYWKEYTAKVAETSTSRIIVADDAKNIFVVGSNVTIITQKHGSTDEIRQSTQADATHRYTITDVQEVTINGTTYCAIYVNASTKFDTVSDADSSVTATCIFPQPWNSGSTDAVLGNTGALNCTDQKHTVKIQGIEFANAQWEILADSINKLWKDTDGKYYYTCYTVNTASKQSTDITSDYIEGDSFPQPTVANTQTYIKYENYKNGMYYPTVTGGSSATYAADLIEINGNVDNGRREFMCFGVLDWDATAYGLSCLYLSWGLGNPWWTYAARLSPNGNRGVWGA